MLSTVCGSAFKFDLFERCIKICLLIFPSFEIWLQVKNEETRLNDLDHAVKREQTELELLEDMVTKRHSQLDALDREVEKEISNRRQEIKVAY